MHRLPDKTDTKILPFFTETGRVGRGGHFAASHVAQPFLIGQFNLEGPVPAKPSIGEDLDLSPPLLNTTRPAAGICEPYTVSM
ncbi:hypothetical protein VTK26DRAFT_5028 [Humicola hyalothermophila]